MLRIQESRRASTALWDDLAANTPGATFYQTRIWHEVASRHPTPRSSGVESTEPDPLYLGFSDGARVVVPRVRLPRKVGLIARHLASPECCYAGVLTDRPLSSTHHALLARSLEASSYEWRRNPFQEFTPPGARALRQESTVLLDLSSGVDAIEEEWRARGSVVPRNARRAQRAGVTVRLAESYEDFARYHAIHSGSAKRWIDPAVCPLQKMWTLHEAAPQAVQLWLAEIDGCAICGQLFFVHAGHVSVYNKGAEDAALEHRAPTMLDVAMIRHFAECGNRWYDFGESGGGGGGHAYKLKFCPTETDASVHIHRSRIHARLDRVAAALRRRTRPVERRF
ncbi:hypothetical protein ASA1KI_36140 [Opitutales bacterium ASA1]|uniref:GNAT family N-acetyltransferase n=1 Tax=Congregicoccus parvus TaxID=3081749 RepID=UPI002B2C220A|nr:hypothetical protein ASA1KI_36140 [Opitutales bacterium ASA1]